MIYTVYGMKDDKAGYKTVGAYHPNYGHLIARAKKVWEEKPPYTTMVTPHQSPD